MCHRQAEIRGPKDPLACSSLLYEYLPWGPSGIPQPTGKGGGLSCCWSMGSPGQLFPWATWELHRTIAKGLWNVPKLYLHSNKFTFPEYL